MARKQSALKVSNSIEYTTGLPADARTIVELKSDLTDSASFPYPYEGLPVYCKEDKKLYILKGDDPTDAASWEEIGGGGGKFTQDVLWKSAVSVGIDAEQTLAHPASDYDLLCVEFRINTSATDVQRTTMMLDVKGIVYDSGMIRYVAGTTDSYVTFRFRDSSHFQQVAGNRYFVSKITGIKLSSLDGTIGRWEKIGEWTTTTENIPLDLSLYQVLALTSYGGESNKEKRNTAIIRMEDFTVDTELESHIIADVYVYFKNLGNGLYKFGNARTGGGILYGYKETAISDADVQRIAAQVRPVPDGGTTGQALVKKSDADGDAEWGDVKIDVDQTYDATSTNPQSGTAVAEAIADKQDVLTAGRGVEILPDGTINMTKNLMRHTDVLWEGSYGDVRAGAITLSSSITEYDEICIVMGNAFQAVAQTLGLVSLRCNNDYDQSASAYAYIIVSFNGNTATVDGAKRGQNGDSRYILRSPLTNVLGIKYDTTGGGGDVDSALSDTSENAVQNKIIKAELDKKAEGYIVPEILTPVDLETAGQPSFMRAGQIFMLSQRGVVGGQRYTFTQADVDNLVNVTDQNGITFTVTSSEGDSTQITMLGTPPSNVIYMPNMALSGTTAAFLIDPEEVHQIDARLIPGGGGGGETPTLDAVLKKGNQTDSSARFTDELNGAQAEIYANGTYMTGNGTEGMRQFSVSQNGIRAVDNLVGTITPKFVVPFEPSGEDQVAMSNAVKASFKKALGIANDAFVFDVDSDQFTPDSDNPDGKHYGMTITSPTYDELLAMLQTDTLVYARMMYNGGNAYEILQLFHNGNSIYGRYFDVEFPQKRLQFASAYVNKRNNDTYFGTYQDYIGGSVDAYTKAETDALLADVVGDLDTLTTTDKTSAVGAINELDSAVKGLGEPFRVKNWAGTFDISIPFCTEDIANSSIPKIVFSIDAEEGADYQIVGMIAYEVFDAASGGNRINCWPVCQFTGNGQKELSVRWMCGGTTRKTAKRINAWVLLKHR